MGGQCESAAIIGYYLSSNLSDIFCPVHAMTRRPDLEATGVTFLRALFSNWEADRLHAGHGMKRATVSYGAQSSSCVDDFLLLD